MTLEVYKNWTTGPYSELIISSENTELSSGLLNKEERVEMARQLIDCAYGLIFNDKEETANKLIDILNENF